MNLMLPDSGLLFWMTIIFAIVFFILAKFGFPIITGMVDKRAKRIDEAIAAARKADSLRSRKGCCLKPGPSRHGSFRRPQSSVTI